MAVRTPIENTQGMYFITFTCQHWLPLFQLTTGYNSVYKWFDHLDTKGHHVRGYVIMPNHLHAIINFGASKKSINTIVNNGKRFMAYEIVERLKNQNKTEILLQLSDAVIKFDKGKEKIHQVFERSFDCREITSQHFFLQKLSYIHNNPCTRFYNLTKNPVEYKYSSAKFYITGEPGLYCVKDE